jgi:RNA polymerase sigma-70 factor, ECF subfamily
MEGIRQLDTAEAEARTAAFARFVAAHRDRALRLAWRLADGDRSAAEDITQDALVRAWRGLGGFRSEAALGTWFYRILVRQAANYRRWRGLRERFGGWGEADAPDPRPSHDGDPAVRERIGRALAALPRMQREVFVLVHLEQFTVTETAAILRRADGTVKSHLARALRALRNELADLAEPEEYER